MPSRTALRVALRRAAHQLYDAHPLVFDDPIAVRMLGPHVDELRRTPGRNPLLRRRPSSVALRAFLVARSRYAEDLLAQAVKRGVSQYVLLGAGLDTFAHRNPYPSLQVFEVDHLATQRWKQELLRGNGVPSATNLAYVAMDFELQLLSAQLENAGFRRDTPAFFAWLGVVPYIPLSAFRATLQFVVSQPPPSGLVFDYVQPRSALPPTEQLERDSLSARVRRAGEAFQLFFTPKQLAAELTGFRECEDLGSGEINARYFIGRADGLRVQGSSGRTANVWN